MTSYSCFDFRIESSFPLKDLAVANDDRPAVSLQIGSVPEVLEDAKSNHRRLQVAGDRVLLAVPGVARYLIRAGEEITVQPLSDPDSPNVKLFLLGSALGVLCYQRGLLLLHANAVVKDGVAVAFAGDSGAGKSTLAAWFAQAGYQVLCDDVCAVRIVDGQALTWPGLPRLKLWGEAARAFGHDPDVLDLAVEGRDKYHVRVPAWHVGQPIPLREINLLSRAAPDVEPVRTQIDGGNAAIALIRQSYRRNYLPVMGLDRWHFAQCAKLMAVTRVFDTPRLWGYDRIDSEGRRLEAAILN